MGVIKLLSERLINRIAAGEVVERPASVLKELIENSLDARATRIEIETQAGGRALISVADNGSGMTPDDMLLAVERHATSKLTEDTDLMRIDTLGFRGEALPSIGAVSRLTITSSADVNAVGRRLRLSGGKLLGVEETAREPGTTIEVRDLFFNVPARRRFLKSEQTEAAHLLEMAQRFALSRLDLRLTYRHNGHEFLSVSPREDDQTRLARVLGPETAKGMFPFRGQTDTLNLSGFLSRLELNRSRAGGLYLFVNGRPVMDRLLMRAVMSAYQGRLAGGRYPLAVVFLTIDPLLVDVNVHPTKAEVRFRRPADVLTATGGILTQAVSSALRPSFVVGQPSPATLANLGFESTPNKDPQSPTPVTAAQPESLSFTRGFEPREKPFYHRPSDLPPLDMGGTSPPPQIPWLTSKSSPPAAQEQSPSGIRVIGQLFRAYILVQEADGLLILDQHAAHERVIFERLAADLTKGGISSQTLLLPETLELTPTQAILAESLIADLARYGFELEPFGGQTFVLKAAPALLSPLAAVQAVLEILNEPLDFKPRDQLARFENLLLETLACHAAVKAGDPLTLPEMDRLVEDLSSTSLPTNCPHGRPLIFSLSRREIEKKFHRG